MSSYGYALEEKLRLKREAKEKKQGKMLPGNPDYYTSKNPHWNGKEQTYWTKEEVLRLNRLRREVSKHILSKKQWSQKQIQQILMDQRKIDEKPCIVNEQMRLDHFV